MARSKKSKDEEDVLEVDSSEPLELESPLEDVAEAQENADVLPPETAEIPDPGPAPEPVPTRRSGGLAMLLGGVVTAALGFGAAQYAGNDRWPFQSLPSAADELVVVVEAQKDEISALKSTVADLTETISALPTSGDVDGLRDTQTNLNDAVGGLRAEIQDLGQRVGDVENRPIPEVGATADAVAAYERELAAMREMFEGELARIEAAQLEAVATEMTATQLAENAVERALLAQLNAAVENGTDIEKHLTALSDADVMVPDVLWDIARAGVPSLAQLQNEFPAVARSALNAAIRADADSGETSRLSAFLRTQLGTRSLEAKEGDDPDAVLSRAEAALRSGAVSQTLDELQAMPSASAPMLTDWIASASRRQDAIAAIASMAETLNE